MPGPMDTPSTHIPMPAEAAACPRSHLRMDPRRWALAAVGLALLGMGTIGIFLPGIPTTIFLILASACFAKSCPPMERWLREQAVFRPYARYLDADAVMPRRARVISISMMWTAIIISGVVFWQRDLLAYAGPPLALAGVIGTVCIAKFRRGPACD